MLPPPPLPVHATCRRISNFTAVTMLVFIFSSKHFQIHEILTIAGYPVLNLATSYMVQCHAALHVCHTAILLQI